MTSESLFGGVFARGAVAGEVDGAAWLQAMLDTEAALARVTAPVMMYAGQTEIGPTPELAAEAAGLFPGWELTVQAGAGHYPWLDDPAWFTARLLAFLG